MNDELNDGGPQPTLIMWTIYDHPSDKPEYFVARKWEVYLDGALATDIELTSTSLPALRAMLPRGLTRLIRDPNDDPVIVETWL